MSVFYSKEFNFQEFWEQSKQDIEKKLPTKELFFVSNKGRIRKQRVKDNKKHCFCSFFSSRCEQNFIFLL